RARVGTLPGRTRACAPPPGYEPRQRRTLKACLKFLGIALTGFRSVFLARFQRAVLGMCDTQACAKDAHAWLVSCQPYRAESTRRRRDRRLARGERACEPPLVTRPANTARRRRARTICLSSLQTFTAKPPNFRHAGGVVGN